MRQRPRQHVLHVARCQAVTRNGVAVDSNSINRPPLTRSAYAGGARHGAHDRLDLGADTFEFAQSGPGHLDADGRFDAVESMSMRVMMGMVQALLSPGICTASFSASVNSSCVRGDARRPGHVVLDVHRRPFRFRLQLDGRFDHVHRRGSVPVSARPALPNTVFTFGKTI